MRAAHNGPIDVLHPYPTFVHDLINPREIELILNNNFFISSSSSFICLCRTAKMFWANIFFLPFTTLALVDLRCFCVHSRAEHEMSYPLAAAISVSATPKNTETCNAMVFVLSLPLAMHTTTTQSQAHILCLPCYCWILAAVLCCCNQNLGK